MDSAGKSILLADHTAGTLPPMIFQLTQAGLHLHESGNIVDTLALIHDVSPDIVVLRPSESPIPRFEVEAVTGALRSDQFCLLALDRLAAPEEELAICSQAEDYAVGATADELAARIRVMALRCTQAVNLAAHLKRLEEESITDFKTELFNDRYIVTRLQEEFDRSNRHRLVLSVVMLDFDDFKQINDTLGHAFGDFVLLSFARKLKSLIRKIDIPGRLGGDEFLIILPNTDLDEAVRIADRIRSIVNSYKFERNGVSAKMTVSLGINAYGGDGSISWEEFLEGADLGLLAAKSRGKNRIFLFPSLKAKEDGLGKPEGHAGRRWTQRRDREDQ